jgi:hypothetical protein
LPDGQITYQRQQPVPTRRQDAAATEVDLLTTARTALDRLTTAVVSEPEQLQRLRVGDHGCLSNV